MLKRRILLATTAATLLFSAAATAQYKDEYTVSTVLPSAFPWGQAADKWLSWCGSAQTGAST